jgi:hypothetical protein
MHFAVKLEFYHNVDVPDYIAWVIIQDGKIIDLFMIHPSLLTFDQIIDKLVELGGQCKLKIDRAFVTFKDIEQIKEVKKWIESIRMIRKLSDGGVL